MCMACIDTRTPCLAMVLSEHHAEKLEERLTRYCLDKFQEQGHTLFRSDCKLGQQKPATEDQGEDKKVDEKEKDEGEKKKKKKDNPQPEEKKKKRKKKSSSSDSGSESEKKAKKDKKKKNKKKKTSSEAEEW